jgi:hypothetical protein
MTKWAWTFPLVLLGAAGVWRAGAADRVVLAEELTSNT